jgi:hypothetical protein
MKRIAGQALVEFAVGLAAFVLLGLGTATLAGYQEVQRRSIIAARQVAFDAIWRQGRALSRPVVERSYTLHLEDPGLRDATGRSRLLTQQDFQVEGSRQSTPGVAATAVHSLVDPLAVVGGFLGGEFDLAADGYARGAVSVHLRPLASLPAPFDQMDIQLSQPYALLGDAWNASGSPQVRRRTSGLVPTQSLAALSGLWRGLAAPIGVFEPSLRDLCLGLIEPEGIPTDRLGPGTGIGPGAPCH